MGNESLQTVGECGNRHLPLKYEIKCPQCGYLYWIESLKPIEYELCPMCGCFKSIEEFIYKTYKEGEK